MHTLENKKGLNNINSHFKKLEEQNKPKINRKKEIMKVRVKMNSIKSKK